MPRGLETIDLNNLDLPDLSWHNQSACSKDPTKADWWMKSSSKPVKEDSNSKFAKAIKICNTECPVKQQCENWILRIEANYGYAQDIYAGMVPATRRKNRLCPVCFKPVVATRKANKEKANGKYCSDRCERDRINKSHAKADHLEHGEQNLPGTFYKQGRIA